MTYQHIRFNEAAGIPRGRRLGPYALDLLLVRASMRPRVFPAEDQPNTAARGCPRRSFNEAAGIPRGRPGSRLWSSRIARGFNEAAGIPRGRPQWVSEGRVRYAAASMRPRVFPAEDAGGVNGMSGELDGFNEAAGIPRGRRPRPLAEVAHDLRFNEAAGIPRGRRDVVEQAEAGEVASMRPRVFPAEDKNLSPTRQDHQPRFNEAAGIPRGRRGGPRSSGRRWRMASMRPRVFPAEDDDVAVRRDCGDQGFNEAAGIPRGRRADAVGGLYQHAALQ